MIWLNWFSGRFGFSNAASVRGKIGSVNPCSSAVKKSRHLNRSPHPQPLSHPMGEGGVGLSPFEAEREKLSASISVCAAGSGGVHPNTAPERGCVPLGAGSAAAASQIMARKLIQSTRNIRSCCGWSPRHSRAPWPEAAWLELRGCHSRQRGFNYRHEEEGHRGD